MRHSLLLPILLVTHFGLLGTGCKPRPKPPVALQVHISADPVSLDPTFAEDGTALKILANTMEGLVCYDGKGDLKNCLTNAFEITPDQKKYTFSIRPTAMWSDGKPVTAQDFITSFKRVLKPQSTSKFAQFLFPIRGAKEFHQGLPGASLGVTDQNGKLVIELEEPVSYFLSLLTLPCTTPLRQDILDAHPDAFRGQGSGKWPDDAPVTGAYQIAYHRTDQSFLLEPNANYWGNQEQHKQVYLPVMIRIVQDESTASNLFESGKLDIFSKVPPLDIERLRKMGVIHQDPQFATYFVGFNTRKKPFENKEWRKAVAGAIDRPGIIQMMAEGDLPARSWIPQGLEGFIQNSEPKADFSKEMTAIHAQIKKNPALAPSITAAFDTSGRNSQIMEKIQKDLQNTLGLQISLNNLDWKSYLKQLTTDAPQIYRLGWLAPFRDPVIYLEIFTSGNPSNYSGWSSPVYDQLVSDVRRLPSGEAREAKVRQAEKMLVDDEAIVVPIFHYTQVTAVSKRVEGFRVNPFSVILFREITVK